MEAMRSEPDLRSVSGRESARSGVSRTSGRSSAWDTCIFEKCIFRKMHFRKMHFRTVSLQAAGEVASANCTGLLHVDPPVLSRFYQELTNGALGLCHAYARICAGNATVRFDPS